MNFRLSWSVVNFRQFLYKLYRFLNLEYWKYTVSRTFLVHALKFAANTLYMTLMLWNSDQVWVFSLSVNFCMSYTLSWAMNIGKYTVFRTFLLYSCTFLQPALTYWGEIGYTISFYTAAYQMYESSVWSSFIRKLEEWYMTGVLCTVCGALVRLLQLLIGFRWNLTISKSSMPSIKWVFFVSITNLRWPPWPLIGWNIFRLLLCNRWMDFDETWQEIQHQTCNYYQ